MYESAFARALITLRSRVHERAAQPSVGSFPSIAALAPTTAPTLIGYTFDIVLVNGANSGTLAIDAASGASSVTLTITGGYYTLQATNLCEDLFYLLF
jgi:hypothetical protein